MELTEVIRWEHSSFHGTTIHTTPQRLMDLADKNNLSYEDCNDGEDKTNFDFSFQVGEDLQFTVYDWKEYRVLDLNREYRFHIGGKNEESTTRAKRILKELIQ